MQVRRALVDDSSQLIRYTPTRSYVNAMVETPAKSRNPCRDHAVNNKERSEFWPSTACPMSPMAFCMKTVGLVLEVELRYSEANTAGRERSNSCRKGEELLQQEASSHGAERLSVVNLSFCCMAHAWCLNERKSSTLHTKPSSPPARP